jgi:hypothetical protein
LKRKPRAGKTYGLPTFARFVESFFARRTITPDRKNPSSLLGGFFNGEPRTKA